MIQTTKKLCLFCVIIVILLHNPLNGNDSVTLIPSAPDSDLLKEAGTDFAAQKAMDPETYRLVGIFNDPGFSINSTQNISVKIKGGRTLPLEIETSSLISEFGSIVSLRLAFEISSAEFSRSRDLLRLVWGRDVTSDNEAVDTVFPSAQNRTAYITFTWKTSEERSKTDSEDSFASIEVVAESGAEHYYLWYLLPMGLIFLLLTIRKIFSR